MHDNFFVSSSEKERESMILYCSPLLQSERLRFFWFRKVIRQKLKAALSSFAWFCTQAFSLDLQVQIILRISVEVTNPSNLLVEM